MKIQETEALTGVLSRFRPFRSGRFILQGAEGLPTAQGPYCDI